MLGILAGLVATCCYFYFLWYVPWKFPEWCTQGSTLTDCHAHAARERGNTTDIRVIMPSASQTATTSTTHALRELGIMAWHADDMSIFAKALLYDPYLTDRFAERWVRTATRCGVEAISLEPLMDLFPFVLERSPGAKVIYNWRDYSSWQQSTSKGHGKNQHYNFVLRALTKSNQFLNAMRWIDEVTGIFERVRKEGHPFYGAGINIPALMYRNTCSGYEWFDVNDLRNRGVWKTSRSEEAFLALMSEVVKLTPEGDLLIFDPKKHGFKEIAEFLGLPVPRKPFPHPRKKDARTNEPVMENNYWFTGVAVHLAFCSFTIINYLTIWILVLLLLHAVVGAARYFNQKSVAYEAAALRRLEDALAECPVVAVLGTASALENAQVGQVLAQAGVRVLEVPVDASSASAEEASSLLRHLPQGTAVVAGSVKTKEDLDAAKAAGFRLVRCLHAQHWLLSHARRRRLVPIAGVASANEAMAALHHGAVALTLLPCEQVTLEVLEHLREVLPEAVPIIAAWIRAPQAVAAYRDAGASGVAVRASSLNVDTGPEGVKRRVAAVLAQR